MVAIATMLYRDPIGGISALKLGEWLLYAAAALTLWSMGVYLKAAWPTIMSRGRHRP